MILVSTLHRRATLQNDLWLLLKYHIRVACLLMYLSLTVCMQGMPYILPVWPWQRSYFDADDARQMGCLSLYPHCVCLCVCAYTCAVLHLCVIKMQALVSLCVCAHVCGTVWPKNMLVKCYRVVSAAGGEVVLQWILVLWGHGFLFQPMFINRSEKREKCSWNPKLDSMFSTLK